MIGHSTRSSTPSPIIGISANLMTIETGVLRGRERASVGQDYVSAIAKAGGTPIVLPIVESDALIAQQLDLIDGLLLSGGYDIHPHFFGEEPHALLDMCYPDRDFHEITLAQSAHRLKKPIFGICRGLQLINVAFGGTLHQDLTSSGKETLQHHQKARVDYATHTVDLAEGTWLRKIANQASIRTNSLHHQSIHVIAPGFTVNGRSKDGIIEGIEKMEQSFILGVQWHPELMYERDPLMFELFRAFIQAALRRKIE